MTAPWEVADGAAQARRQGWRGGAQRLAERARHLPGPQRALVEQVLLRGAPAADLARLAGEPPRTVQKRLRVLIRRLRDPRFAFLAEHGQRLPAATRRVAQDVLFRGLTLRRAAAASGLSLHAVRQHMHVLRAYAAARGPQGK